MRLRRLAVVALVAAVVLAIPATSGFSATSTDRSAEVAVTDDEDAILEVSQTLSDTNNGTTDLDVTITNRFGSDTTLDTVEVTVGNEHEDLGSLGSGDHSTANFVDVDCDRDVDVVASDSSVEVTLDREIGC